MRAFVAIEIPEEIKDFLKTLQDKLRRSGADVKWVAPGNIHLTLKFLGEIQDKQAKAVADIMQRVCPSHDDFIIALGELGAFPEITSPRIIWVGLSRGGEEATRLAGQLDEEFSLLGIPKEKKEFSPHLTIARTRSGLNITSLIQYLNDCRLMPREAKLQFSSSGVSLIKSNLTPQGPLYEPLKKVNLKAS
ncbi:MAG: RNA 2',3'-cyclic phosphodiesterase [Candidatus Omnitrophota bacterium]|jgi:2'-5' RNA ligase